jgi:hypothetical protein
MVFFNKKMRRIGEPIKRGEKNKTLVTQKEA